MALSTALIRRLNCKDADEPLAKRIKLATNVFYSAELPIIRKEDCILSWLTSELLKNKNTFSIWSTIHRCLSAEAKTFSKLSQETKKCLVNNLATALNNYPQSQVYDNMLKCCYYIFLNTSVHNSLDTDGILFLLEAILKFTCKILHSNEVEINSGTVPKSLAIETSEHSVNAYSQICKENSRKENLITNFLDIVLIPLSNLVKILRVKKIPSKIILEAQKCIRRLLFTGAKNISSSEDNSEKNEEINKIFDALKLKINSLDLEDTKAVVSCIFQCAVNTFQQNPAVIDIVLRKLVNCTDHKVKSKQILSCLLENSTDVSYDFENKIDDISLKSYLKNRITKITSRKKCLKTLDYELLSNIAKLNPLIIEDATQEILEIILFENDIEEIAYENLLKELWSASVRLRRQQKFLSKILVVVSNYKGKEIQDLENKPGLPKNFLTVFSEDLMNKSTNSQILAMFHTLIFHLKTDCFTKLEVPDSSASYLMIKIVADLLVTFFEHSNFLDHSLTHEWNLKFHQAFIDVKHILASAAESICEHIDSYKIDVFVDFLRIVKIWSEVYDLLKYYVPSIYTEELDFPLNETHLKKIKHFMKKNRNSTSEEALNQMLLFKSILCDRNGSDKKQFIKEKIISQVWPEILENHFDLIQFFDNEQVLKLSKNLVREACISEDRLKYWNSILKNNIVRMTKKFATAVVFSIIQSLVKDIEFSASKMIIEKIDFEELLSNDTEKLKKTLKKVKKEIVKNNFKNLDAVNFDEIQLNLTLLSNLPLLFLDTNVRIFLFVTLYTFEEESKNTIDLTQLLSNSYSELLYHNDFDILSYMASPDSFIVHFKDNHLLLKKIFKLSFSNSKSISCWEKFIKDEKCDKKTSSILICCVENFKAFPNDHKDVLQNISHSLKNKVLEEPYEVTIDHNKISGLRVAIKLLLTNKENLPPCLKTYAQTLLNEIVQKSDTNDVKSTQEYLQFSLMILSDRENFDASEDIIKHLCEILINNPDGKILSHFLEVLKDNEFRFFSKLLSDKTEKSLINNDEKFLEKVVVIWEHLSKVETKITRSKTLQWFVNSLLNELISLEIKNTSSVYLLKISRTFVLSKRMIQLTDSIIDSVFITSMKCLEFLDKPYKLSACQEALGLCLDFLRFKVDFVSDRLPALVHLFKKIVSIILTEVNEIDNADEQMLRILAVDIQKFCSFFAKLKKDVVRITPYLIADMIDSMSNVGVLPSFLKTSIEMSISHLLSNHDRHAVSFLSRTLPSSTQQVFKTMFDNYNKYHKFSGKI